MVNDGILLPGRAGEMQCVDCSTEDPAEVTIIHDTRTFSASHPKRLYNFTPSVKQEDWEEENHSVFANEKNKNSLKFESVTKRVKPMKQTKSTETDILGPIISKDFSDCFNKNLIVPQNGSFGLDTVLSLLFQPEHTDCPETCMCKVSHRRTRGPIKEIIDHKWHGGKLFLLCKPHSQRAGLEYLRLCQVNCELRRQYGQSLRLNRRPPLMKDKWTMENELTVRNSLYKELSPPRIRVQEDLRFCENTVEWQKQTGNGKLKVPISVPQIKSTVERPGPVIKTEKQEFYEIEQIIGSSMKKGKRLYFVKWFGYPPSESSWEPEEGLQMAADAIDEFNMKFGFPSATQPTIYSPDGMKFMKATLNSKDTVKGASSYTKK